MIGEGRKEELVIKKVDDIEIGKERFKNKNVGEIGNVMLGLEKRLLRVGRIDVIGFIVEFKKELSEDGEEIGEVKGRGEIGRIGNDRKMDEEVIVKWMEEREKKEINNVGRGDDVWKGIGMGKREEKKNGERLVVENL